jgi:hypothetical protein
MPRINVSAPRESMESGGNSQIIEMRNIKKEEKERGS